jgi:hypothetical protein
VALADIYAPPAQPPNSTGLVGALWICNTDTVARTVTIRIGTGTLTAANSILDGTSIDANSSYVLLGQGDFSLTLQAGQKIQGLASVASKITVTVMGVEQI